VNIRDRQRDSGRGPHLQDAAAGGRDQRSDQALIGKGRVSVTGLTKGALGQIYPRSRSTRGVQHKVMRSARPRSGTRLGEEASELHQELSRLRLETGAEAGGRFYPIKRIGEHEGWLVLFLCTEEAGFITGSRSIRRWRPHAQ